MAEAAPDDDGPLVPTDDYTWARHVERWRNQVAQSNSHTAENKAGKGTLALIGSRDNPTQTGVT